VSADHELTLMGAQQQETYMTPLPETFGQDEVSPPRLSVIVPTYKEVENLPELIKRLGQVKEDSGISLELILADDDSQDGTEALIQEMNLPWIHLLTRKEDRGLSQSVLEGLHMARGDVLAVMDADLSHPPEKLPYMVHTLDDGADFVIGSRHVRGASTDENWGFYRWMNSFIATLLARPLTATKDPMSGFFAMRKSTLEQSDFLNPIGYKISLELMIKCRCKDIREVPIHFADRQHGESKLCLTEQLRYIQHLRRLYLYKYELFSSLIQFIVVGLSGTAVNLLALTILLLLLVPVQAAFGLAIVISMFSNFLLNRRFSFSHAKNGPFFKQMIRFAGACSLGAFVNFCVALIVFRILPENIQAYPQVAALFGIAAATLFNFIASRYLVFRQEANG
jgi:dolichol-phosphate mannosyltransferase